MKDQITMWVRAVEMQQARILGGYGPSMEDRVIDGNLFSIALRLFYRACEARSKATSSPQLNAALEVFRARVPGVVHIRDVTEHFDEYATAQGGKLGPGVKPPIHSFTAGTNNYWVQAFEFKDGNIVHVYELNVADAAGAARELADVALAV
jgi:hypothetical protein